MERSSPSPSPGAPIRWGIVGAGAIAGRFARDLAHVPGAILSTVFARRPEAAHQLAASHGARPVSTLDDLFATPLDAVYIATLPDTHHAFARAALEAGLPVLCEKPVTRSLAELDDLLTLARARNLLFMEAMKTPFLPLYCDLRHHLDAATPTSLGPISLVLAGNASIYTPADHPSWRADLAGGALMAIGVYQAFLAVDWLGPATEVQVLTQSALSQPQTRVPHLRDSSIVAKVGSLPTIPQAQTAVSEVDTLTLLQSRHQHGLSQLYAGLALGSPGTATLAGPGGFATVHKPWWNPSRATITPAAGTAIDLHHPVLGDGLHYETAHFCDLLRAGATESPIVSHAHSRAVMHLLDRARAAIGLHFPGEPNPSA